MTISGADYINVIPLSILSTNNLLCLESLIMYEHANRHLDSWKTMLIAAESLQHHHSSYSILDIYGHSR